jgi:antitoxin MazE
VAASSGQSSAAMMARQARPTADSGLIQLPGRGYIVITTMKAQLVRIGNSRGVRLPKALIDQVGLTDEIDLRVENHCVVIAPVRPPRSGWADAARQLSVETKKAFDGVVPTRFDEAEWQW